MMLLMLLLLKTLKKIKIKTRSRVDSYRGDSAKQGHEILSAFQVPIVAPLLRADFH